MFWRGALSETSFSVHPVRFYFRVHGGRQEKKIMHKVFSQLYLHYWAIYMLIFSLQTVLKKPHPLLRFYSQFMAFTYFTFAQVKFIW